MNPFDVTNKLVVVTGGTRGLGRAISLHLASQGARVIAGYFQNQASAESLRQECMSRGESCVVVRANLMTATGIQLLADYVRSHSAQVDALVYNSATGVHKPLDELNVRHFSGVWQLNVGAFFELCAKLRNHFRNGSKIVAISSEGARNAVRHYGSVGSSKAALEALCRQMAVEWASNGVSVNVASPGLLRTDTMTLWEDADKRIHDEEKASPLGRLVKLQEVATAVHFFCSAASDGITGQTLVIDGGKSISSID